MKRITIFSITLMAFCCFLSPAQGKELVSEFKGSDNKTTADFEVVAPWILDWRVTGDYPGSMAVQVDLVDAQSGEYIGKVFSTKWVTDGVRLFNEGGRYRLQVISSLANWTLRIEQLSKQEAGTYIPKEKL